MKPVSNDYLLMLLGNEQFAFGELYTVTLRDGTNSYFTDLDVPITYGGNTFLANTLRFEGMKFKIAVGWQVDEQELKIDAFPTDTLAGSNFFSALQDGLLDGAIIVRQRAFWLSSGYSAATDFATAPLDVITLFTGYVSAITKLGRTFVELKLKSPLKLLDTDMPRNYYSPSCLWSLFDTGCTLLKASFTTSFTVVSATKQNITVAAIGTPTGGDGLPNYAQGSLIFTSGANNNLQTSIASNDSTIFYLRFPLITAPSPGDTFDASVGCSKLSTTCADKFSNLNNFRGFPRVPPVVVSV